MTAIVAEKLRALPDIPDDLPPATHDLLTALKENLELLAGISSPLNRAITVSDLYNRGLASITLDGVTYTPDVVVGDTDNVTPIGAAVIVRPPAPENVAVFSGLGSLWLTWTSARYPGHLHTEVWRSESNDVGTAALLDVATTSFYQDPLGLTNETRYYWLRHVNLLGTPGSYHAGATAGATATTSLVDNADVAPDAITVDKIFTTSLSAIVADLGTVTAGKLESSDGTFVVDLDNKQVMIAGPTGQATDDYLVLQTGVLEMYKWTGATHVLYKALRNRQSGFADSGTTVAIPGYFESQPTITVTPRDIKLYDATYSNQDQSIQFLAENISEYATGQWQFDAKAQLSLATNTGNTIVTDASGPTALNTWTSSTYTTPSNTTDIIVYVTVSSKRGTGTAPNWYYRKVDWKIWYRVSPAGPWNSTTNQTVSIGAQFNPISDNRALVLPGADTYDIYVEFTAADAGGTFSDGSGTYSYHTDYRYDATGQETADNDQTSFGCFDQDATLNASLNFGAYTPPSGYTVYNVTYYYRGRYRRYAEVAGTFNCSSAISEALNTFPNGVTRNAVIDGVVGTSGSDLYATLAQQSFSQGSYSSSLTASARSHALGWRSTGGYGAYTRTKVRIYDGQAVIQSRKLNVNSTTPENSYSFDSYDWFLSAAQILATGKLSWSAVGE